MHLIRRVVSASFKLETLYRYFIRLAQTDKTSKTNLIHRTYLIRFKRRTIVKFTL